MNACFHSLNERIWWVLKFGNNFGWFIVLAFSGSTVRVYCRVLDCTSVSQWRSARHYLHYWLGTGGFRSAVTGSPNLCCQMKRPWGGVQNNEQTLGATSSNQNSAIKRATTKNILRCPCRRHPCWSNAVHYSHGQSLWSGFQACWCPCCNVFTASLLCCQTPLAVVLSPYISPTRALFSRQRGSFFPGSIATGTWLTNQSRLIPRLRTNGAVPVFPAMYFVHKKNFVHRG